MREGQRHLGPPAPLPLVFEVDGTTFTLPDLDTRVWLDALVLDPPACWWQLIPVRLAAEGGNRLWERLRDSGDPFDIDHVEHVAETVLGEALGLDFHAGRRLAAMAYGNWLVFDGWCWTRGVDPLREPIGRVLAAVYHWRRSLCTKESEVSRVESEVWAPPPAVTASGRSRDPVPPGWSDELESQGFAQVMAMFGDRGA